jgi:hypothetical protein
MANIQDVLKGGFSGQYSSLNDFKTAISNLSENDKIDVSALRGVANSYVSSRSRGTNAGGDAINRFNSGIGGVFSSAINTTTNLAFSLAFDQKNYDRSIVKLGDIQTIFTQIASNGFNVVSQASTVLATMLKYTDDILSDAFMREGVILESLTAKAGLVGQIASDLEKTINNDVVPGAAKMGINFNDVNTYIQNMVKNSERFTQYQSQTLLDALKIGAAYGVTAGLLLESVESFRNVGISLADATEDIENIGDKSINQGLSARATTKTVIDNLEKLNSFGFKNGVEGLGRMVREAQSLKFNMSEIFTVAEKLYDPEGAISLSANLQVIGGAFGDLADPIKLMYDVTNDMEGLQTSILGAARSLATYNVEQGRFEVTGANLRRAKAMADAMGVSMKELTGAAVKGQVQMQALSEIQLFDLTEDQQQFVSNLATMKGGVIGFDVSKEMGKNLGIKEGFLSLQDLNTDQLKKVVAIQQKIAEKTPEDLIKDQYTVATQSLNALNAIALRIGNVARNKIQDDKIYNAVITKLGGLDELSEKSTEEINLAYTDVISKMVDPVLNNLIEMGKTVFDGASDYIEQNIDTDLMKDMLREKSSDITNEVSKVLGEIFLNVKVDLNSQSAELANIIVNAIGSDADLKRKLANSLIQNGNKFLP